MSDTSQKDSPFNIPKEVEETLLGIFLLIGQILKTFINFFIRPRTFGKVVVNSDPLSNNYSKDFARPLNYYFLTLTILIFGFILLIKIDSEVWNTIETNPFLVLFLDAIKRANFTGLVLGLSPFILALGLFSFCMSRMTKKGTFDFVRSLHMTSYYFGSLNLVFVLYTPIAPLVLSGNMDEFYSSYRYATLVVLSILAAAILIRALYSYWVLLNIALEGTKNETLSVFLRGILFFSILYGLVLFWLSPLVFELIEARKHTYLFQ